VSDCVNGCKGHDALASDISKHVRKAEKVIELSRADSSGCHETNIGYLPIKKTAHQATYWWNEKAESNGMNRSKIVSRK
jgi:hypothetical protein